VCEAGVMGNILRFHDGNSTPGQKRIFSRAASPVCKLSDLPVALKTREKTEAKLTKQDIQSKISGNQS